MSIGNGWAGTGVIGKMRYGVDGARWRGATRRVALAFRLFSVLRAIGGFIEVAGAAATASPRQRKLATGSRSRVLVAMGCSTVLALGSTGCGTTSRSPSSSSTAVPAGGASTSSSQGAPARTGPFKVASTLDGMTVLPRRIQWAADPALPQSQISEIEWLIDGRLAWVEPDAAAPYVYADFGGYLVTSFLSPGEHRFEVRVIPVHGRAATDTLIARVLPPPEVPAALAGSWERDVKNTSGAPAAGSLGNPENTLTPPGVYKITFERRWIFDTFPCTDTPCTAIPSTGAGTEFASDWTPGATTFSVRGAVTSGPNDNTARLGGAWCEQWGPPATYTWAVSGTTLKLEPVGGDDACGIRGFIWSGTWTRVH